MPIIDGYVIANIPAGVAFNAPGATNLAATFTDNQVLLLGTYNAIWYSVLDEKPLYSPWSNLDQAIAYNIRAEVGALGTTAGGTDTFNAWWTDSGYPPSAYGIFLTYLNTIYYIMPGTTWPTYTAWPTLAQAKSNNIWLDAGTWPYDGPVYFEVWWDESGVAAGYESILATMGRIWYSKLDTLV